MVDILLPGIRAVFNLSHIGPNGEADAVHSVFDNGFDFVFQGIRELIALPVKKLDAVKFHRIMGSRNHYPCIHFIFPGKVCHCRGGDNAYIYCIGSHGADSRHQRICQHIPGNSGITPYHDSGLVLVFFGQYISACLPKLHGKQRRQFIISHPPYTICTKQSAHP